MPNPDSMDLPPEFAKRIAAKLCPNAVVNVCSCGQGGGVRHQNLADMLQAKVCACTHKVKGRCNCLGKWVCKNPTPISTAKLAAQGIQASSIPALPTVR